MCEIFMKEHFSLVSHHGVSQYLVYLDKLTMVGFILQVGINNQARNLFAALTKCNYICCRTNKYCRFC
jgi:hypothetical protein